MVLTTVHPESAGGAEAGDRDLIFGDQGVVSTKISNLDDGGSGVAIQTDGRIVVCGVSNVGSGNSDFAVIRYNPDGSLDNDFGIDGIVTTDISGIDDYATALVVDANGKIVVAGVSIATGQVTARTNFAVVRYLSDGRLDPDFDDDGIVETSFTKQNDQAAALAIQNDGKIVVAGTADIGSGDSDFAIARYHPDGSLDTSFDSDGKVTTSFSPINDQGHAVAIQTDQKIIVAGTANLPSGNSDFALARYHPDGSLDLSFDGDGLVTTGITKLNDEANGVAVQGDGSIFAAGTSDLNSGNSRFAVVAYNKDGSLDSTFGTGGIEQIDISLLDDMAAAIAIQTDAQLILVGTADSGRPVTATTSFAVVRINSSGGPDDTFGDQGVVTTKLSSLNDAAAWVALDSDENIVVVGTADQGSSAGSVFAVVRYVGASDSPPPSNGGATGAVGCFIQSSQYRHTIRSSTR